MSAEGDALFVAGCTCVCKLGRTGLRKGLKTPSFEMYTSVQSFASRMRSRSRQLAGAEATSA